MPQGNLRLSGQFGIQVHAPRIIHPELSPNSSCLKAYSILTRFVLFLYLNHLAVPNG